MRVGLATALLFFLGVSGASAQNPDYILDITDSAGPVGEQATVATTLDATTGSQVILAYQWGVCHDPLVEVSAVETGADVMALNGGNGPDFIDVGIVPGDGWNISVVISNAGQESLPPGGVYEMHLATYDLLEEGTASLEYCDTLGPLTALLCPCSVPIFPTLEGGVIDIGVPPGGFLRGDIDGNGVYNPLVDAIFLLAFQFQGGATPPCLEAADADGNVVVNGLVDALYILVHGFQGGPPPPAPFPNCGNSPAGFPLGCDVYTC